MTDENPWGYGQFTAPDGATGDIRKAPTVALSPTPSSYGAFHPAGAPPASLDDLTKFLLAAGSQPSMTPAERSAAMAPQNFGSNPGEAPEPDKPERRPHPPERNDVPQPTRVPPATLADASLIPATICVDGVATDFILYGYPAN